MKIKKCLKSEVPVPPNGYGYFYLDQETNKLKLKKITEIISWDLFGVDKYKELCPNVDLVTMDITMPRMDGITALEQIMAFDKNAKVIMVSALGKEELVKKSLLLGAKNYIVKPLDRKKVLERISACLK